MQTFYTSPNLCINAVVLDNKRLNKQLLEGRQVLDALSRPDIDENGRVRAWSHHPATLMWKGSEGVLMDYLLHVAEELRVRKIRHDNNLRAIENIFIENFADDESCYTKPKWMLDPVINSKVIITHRGNLYHKFPEHYVDFREEYEIYRDFVCCNRCNYYWPTHRQ